MEPLFEELQCPVCLETYNCPVILPCSHILCRSPCAERLLNHGFVRCPVCRDNSYVAEGVQSFPRVISIENIISRLKQPRPETDLCRPGDTPCQLCQQTPRRATKSCTDCNASYCVRCLAISHPDKEPFIQHHLVEPVQLKRPVELKCRQHDELVNIYCKDCNQLGCVLCVDSDGQHPGHRILSLEQAATHFKDEMEANLNILDDDQEAVNGLIRLHQRQLGDFQCAIDVQRRQTREQCESLIAEVHSKMEFFLSDLEYEQKSKSSSLVQRIDVCRQHTLSLSSMTQYSRNVLKEDDEGAFLQLALAADERVKALLSETKDECMLSPDPISINNKVVDLRKEKAILRDMSYLEAPHTPVIDVAKCSRSKNSVVLVLSPPLPVNDVVDGYKVYYCSELHQATGEQQMMIFKTPGEERKYGRATPSCSAVCLIQENLDSGIMYYFCTRAYNLAGESEMSEIINCTTLSEALSTLPAPEIIVGQSRTYSCSIQIHSPSPLATNPALSLTFYLLYREASGNKIWKSVSLYNRADHRVFGLDADTMYDFVIMSCDSNGECQVSNMVTLRTEISAY